MTDASTAPEAPDVAKTAHFLRRFADLMSTGSNAAFLLHAAGLLETLTARVSVASDEEQVWRNKYETLTHQNDVLEAECDSLKHDIEGHLNITNSLLRERDALKAALQARETQFSELGGVVNREREQLATKSKDHEAALAELGVRSKELDRLRRVFEREREGLQSQLKSREDEMAALRVEAERDSDALKTKIAALQARRAELRAAFERISDLRTQTRGSADGVDRSVPAQSGEPASAVVPKAALLQARAQFEYLAKECTRRGDIASQVMCELEAYTMDQALIADEKPDHLPVSEVAQSILAPSAAQPAAPPAPQQSA